ncbi:hypothetical protein ScPMuIL_005758 [Solemya velum]
MGETGGFVLSERTKFLACFNRFSRFVYRDEDQIRTDLNLLLDELNSIEYSISIVKTEEINHLFVKLCNVVPIHQERLLVKLCQAVYNIRNKHVGLLSVECVTCVAEFLIRGVQRCQAWAMADILRALAKILKENVNRLSQFHDALLGEHGILVQLTFETVTDVEVLTEAVHCLENITIRVTGQPYLEDVYAVTAFSCLLQLLHRLPQCKMDANTQCQVLMSSLRGIQNIIIGTKTVFAEHIGSLLACVRAYMFHGLVSHPATIPARLYPMPLSQYDTNPATNKTTTSPQKTEEGTKLKEKNKESVKKSKKKRNKKTKDEVSDVAPVHPSGDSAEQGVEGGRVQIEAPVLQTTDESSYPPWARISSSESDYSDTEGGQGSRLRSSCIKVRQSALSCLHTLIKNADRKVIFGYWSSFIPDSQSPSSPQPQTLFTIIIKDPSPKCRMGALAALTALIDGTKPYLAVANDIEHFRMAFVPFSTILGSTIKELHRCLLLALVAENYPLTVTQVIKCLATLILNVPYHRMRPGLLSRVIKHVRHFINHKDPNVRVACLTCFGAIVGIQPPVMEVCHIIQSAHPPVGTRYVSQSESGNAENTTEPDGKNLETSSSTSENMDSELSSSKAGTSRCDSGTLLSERSKMSVHSHNHSPGFMTPVLAGPSGSRTPIFADPDLQAVVKETSWLIKMCSKNIITQRTEDASLDLVGNSVNLEPIPVRLESLQVLSLLTKGYFPIIRNSVPLLQDLICQCLEDSDPVIKLHGAKLLDELTQAMLRDLTDTVAAPDKLDLQQVLTFWTYLLSYPVPTILQLNDNNQVRASTCDCLANIGQQVFGELSVDRRILCVTLSLGLTSDPDKFVRASAVRVLGVLVLFPILREDISFMTDAANAVLTCLFDTSINVRWKAAWSLANICDALVNIREEGGDEILSEFPDALLIKMFTACTRACQDSEKVRSNAVRAMGNILRYLPDTCIEQNNFLIAIGDGIKALVKNIGTGLMKVRWNACYAVSNIFRNSRLPYQTSTWTKDVLTTLCSVVKDCKNFKVRINAALALSIPSQRGIYGNTQGFLYVWNSLIGGLKALEDNTDFSDYRYRDSLSDQICVALLHLVSMVTPDDLEVISSSTEDNHSLISTYLHKHKTGPTTTNSHPHKSLQEARDHIFSLDVEDLSAIQEGTLNRLLDLCQLIPENDIDGEKPEKSAFVQVYD